MRLFIACFLLLLLIGAPVSFGFTALQSLPAVEELPTVQAANAQLAMNVMNRFQHALETNRQQTWILASESEINSVMLFAARALPSFRGRAIVTDTDIQLAVSAKPPRLPGNKWLNLSLTVSPSPQGIDITSVRIGNLELSPRIALSVLTFAMDIALGDNLGTLALNGIERLSLRNKIVSIGLNISPDLREALLDRSRERLREVASLLRETNSFGEAAAISGYYVAMHNAASAGQLPRRGSFMPYLYFAFDMARQRAVDGDAAAEMRAALLAVGVYCGIRKLEILVGNVVPDNLRRQSGYCRWATLGGRVDLRQHFIVSAVLKVASDAGMAFAIGEFKELLDANKGGSGFSFDDVAADLAGIRFAATLFAGETGGDVPRKLLVKMTTESEVFPDIKDLPSGLSESNFRRRFGDVDSVPYKAMLAMIESRIDNLAFHAAR